MIKRYDIPCDQSRVEEDEHGDWVKWEDVKEMVFDVGITARRLQLIHGHDSETTFGCGICNFIEKYKSTTNQGEQNANTQNQESRQDKDGQDTQEDGASD